MKPLLIASTLALAAATYVWSSGLVYPHDALPTAAQPNGWKYPFSCCSGQDCREVADSAITETAVGYKIDATGEVVSYLGDPRLKQSPDGKFHWCSVAGAPDGRTICLFAPPRGM